MFDQGGATLDPVSIIVISDVPEPADFGGMDVAADHAIDVALGGRTGDHFLEAGDERDRILDALLHMGGERPIRQAEAPPHEIHNAVGLEQEFVSAVPKEGEPLGIKHDAVELVAVQHQQAAAVRGLVHHLARNRDVAEGEAGIIAQHLVVVARHVDDMRAVLGHLENTTHDIVMPGRPVPALAQPPGVDDVADQIERLALDRLQKVHQQLGIAAGCAEVDVRDPDRPIARALPRRGFRVGFVEPGRQAGRGREGLLRAGTALAHHQRQFGEGSQPNAPRAVSVGTPNNAAS